jgi:hypothetical protein
VDWPSRLILSRTMITATPHTDGEDISFIDDVDALASTGAMLGCGDDNPYH